MSQIINVILSYYVEILFFLFLFSLVVVSRFRIIRFFKKLILSIEFFDKLVSQKIVNLYDEYSRFTKVGCRGISFRLLFLRNVYWLLPILYVLIFFGVTKTISSLEDGNCAHAMETPIGEMTEAEARKAMLGTKLNEDIDYCINNLKPNDLVNFMSGMENIWADDDTRAVYAFAQKYESPSFGTNTDLTPQEQQFKALLSNYKKILDSRLGFPIPEDVNLTNNNNTNTNSVSQNDFEKNLKKMFDSENASSKNNNNSIGQGGDVSKNSTHSTASKSVGSINKHIEQGNSGVRTGLYGNNSIKIFQDNMRHMNNARDIAPLYKSGAFQAGVVAGFSVVTIGAYIYFSM